MVGENELKEYWKSTLLVETNPLRLSRVKMKLSNIKDGTAELLLKEFCGFLFKKRKASL